MTTQRLRDLVEQQIGERWSVWAEKHPNLAGAIDRTRLVQSTVEDLRRDPDFQRLMREADLDEAKLEAAWRLLQLARRCVTSALPV